MGEDSGAVGAAKLSVASNRYVVTEKVHGANFCIIAKFDRSATDAIDVKFAKRTAILGGAADAEDFYGCRSTGLLRALVPCAERVLSRSASASTPSSDASGSSVLDAVHIYGELFGGEYPHPDIAAHTGMQAVQKGVWYSPSLQFMAFDVAVERRRCSRMFLDFGRAQELCEACGLMFAQPLITGSLAECLDYPIEFVTTLP